MKDFYLKRPEETGYDNFVDAGYNEMLLAIQHAINNDIFSIPTQAGWNVYRNKERINNEIDKFGWKIEDKWYGSSKDEGYQIIKIIKILKK